MQLYFENRTIWYQYLDVGSLSCQVFLVITFKVVYLTKQTGLTQPLQEDLPDHKSTGTWVIAWTLEHTPSAANIQYEKTLNRHHGLHFKYTSVPWTRLQIYTMDKILNINHAEDFKSTPWTKTSNIHWKTKLWMCILPRSKCTALCWRAYHLGQRGPLLNVKREPIQKLTGTE